MKIATVTFHRVMNCGAILQAYALQRYCNTKVDAYILDYRCTKIEYQSKYKKTIKNHIIDFLKFFLRHDQISTIIKRRKKFIDFSKEYLRTSKPYYPHNIKKAATQYDAFIAGSDQTLNPKWSNCDWNYFLKFAPSSKRYSYAASFGAEKVNFEYKEQMREQLEQFQCLLLREKKGLSIISELGIDISKCKLVCDPVFLFDKQEWIDSFKLQKNRKKYILVYFAALPTHSIEFTKNLAKETGLEVVYFNSFDYVNLDPSFINLNIAGPQEFLEYIYNAEYVITTSFHAIAFSLIFNTKFYYELNKKGDNDNSRLQNIIAISNVEHCEITNNTSFFANYDWNSINESLNFYANESRTLLDSMLNSIGMK